MRNVLGGSGRVLVTECWRGASGPWAALLSHPEEVGTISHGQLSPPEEGALGSLGWSMSPKILGGLLKVNWLCGGYWAVIVTFAVTPT